jgi:HEPN domain-containing protein
LCFEEPKWTHNPRNQLLGLKRRFNLGEEIATLACNADDVTPWYGKSAYGGKGKDGRWQAAYELCTKDVAQVVLPKAKESFRIAQGVVKGWKT